MLHEKHPAAISANTTQGEFSVYWWDRAGNQHLEKKHCGATEAVETALSFSTRPAARLGAITAIMITDGGDMCNWHWKDGRVIFDGKDA